MSTSKQKHKPSSKPKLDIFELQMLAVQFRDARNWAQFHSLKNLVLDLLVEAGELAEPIVWKSEAELKKLSRKELGAMKDELADVFYTLLLTAHTLDIDIAEALQTKLKKTARRYPIKKSFGSNKKYTEL